ncbi:MAG: helix-turn-helix domain-containing protein [Pseudomonadota bacterium]
MARTYNQECVLAYALDLLGERWTLLIFRELFLGPVRFGDLHAALPGIGTNLLSKRLKELEEAGLVISATPEARSKYRLTDKGEDLRPMMREFMFWAAEYFMKRPEPSAAKDCIFSNDLRPDSVALAIEMFQNKRVLEFSNYVLRLKIDDNPYTFYFMNGEMTAKRGDDAPAIASIESDVETLMRALRGELYINDTVARSTVSGDEQTIEHFVVGLTPGASVAFEVSELIKAARKEHRPERVKARETTTA